ncbi:DUF2490 domain-containing protein [Polaribacter vadi]|uniref:DUF2490 domain-containing protein n=1 Tax=Polaribacter TaxID=52959 RepID=UPI001C096A59|nr:MULTISPECIES: DUF2490 domain-containing protein [Polaribacter]MBU3009951.1 DUF2490 domain-containing protein [Polaribacter vadi]MDO6739757.1 DUF2490 domain-containing protein [Polaribacter sp. 1_MG-2023]
MNIYKKNKNAIIKIVFVNFLLLSNISLAQEGDKDWASWNIIGIEYKLNKKWNFGLEEQFRLKENFSAVDEFFTQLSSEYKVFKGFKLGAAIRYIRENDNQGNVQGYENHFRFQFDAKYKHEINDFTIGYRFRYQNKNELGISVDEGDEAKQNLRFKTSLEYNFKDWKLDPKFSAEIFNRFQAEEDNGFSKYRLTLGTDYKIKNFGELGIYYRYERELNEEYPDVNNILGLKYTYSFKSKKK